MKLLLVLSALVATVLGSGPPTVSYTQGTGNKEKWQTSGNQVFLGSSANRIITGFIVEYYIQDYYKDIVCFDFSYVGRPSKCPDKGSDGTIVRSFEMASDEYITEVYGNYFPFINRLGLKSNKGRKFGPWGQPASQFYGFVHSNDNKPLLWADITLGVWIYDITFVFSDLDVLGLRTHAEAIAKETFNTIKNDIREVVQLDNKYRPTTWFDLAQKGCAQEATTDTAGRKVACQLMGILEHTYTLALSSKQNMVHEPINLMKLANYDTHVYLGEVTLSKLFHNLLTEIKFDLSSIASMQVATATSLRKHFKDRAEFDQNIAEQDVGYFRGKLYTLKQGSDGAAIQVGERLRRILGYAMGAKVIEAAEKAVRLAIAIQGAFSPFKVLLGGPDFGAIFEAIDDLLETLGDIIELSITIEHIKSFTTLLKKIQDAFEENRLQIEDLAKIVENYNMYVVTDELESQAASYIAAYGGYTPYVKTQDVAEMTALLEAMADSACGFIKDNEGSLAANVKNIAQSQAIADCLVYGPDVAKLDSYFDEALGMQFELIDAFTAQMRGKIAARTADDFDKVTNNIDVLTAAIGTAMMEIKFQSAAHSRCNVLEYLNGGMRPSDCEHFLFTHGDYELIRAYKGSLSYNDATTKAFLPTNYHTDENIPVFDREMALKGNLTFRLPINNPTWLENYDWLPDSRSAETAFYMNGMDLYIPGLKCQEAGRSVYAYVQATSSVANKLYKQPAAHEYIVHQQTINFEYTTNLGGCDPSEIETFTVKDTRYGVHDLNQPVRYERVCVRSWGRITRQLNKEHTYPSLYTMWNVKIRGSNECTLMVDPDYSIQPMVSVQFPRYEVIVNNLNNNRGKINECWPDGSRCPEGKQCHDRLLYYSCS